MEFAYVLTVTFTLEIKQLVNIMANPKVMDNNNYYYVKYYLDPTWQQGVMARTQIVVMCSL